MLALRCCSPLHAADEERRAANHYWNREEKLNPRPLVRHPQRHDRRAEHERPQPAAAIIRLFGFHFGHAIAKAFNRANEMVVTRFRRVIFYGGCFGGEVDGSARNVQASSPTCVQCCARTPRTSCRKPAGRCDRRCAPADFTPPRSPVRAPRWRSPPASPAPCHTRRWRSPHSDSRVDFVTPGTPASVFSTPRAQLAQVIPRTDNFKTSDAILLI